MDGDGLHRRSLGRNDGIVDTQQALLRLVLPLLCTRSHSATRHVLDWFSLSHTALWLHRESLLPDGGRHVDVAFRVDAL